MKYFYCLFILSLTFFSVNIFAKTKKELKPIDSIYKIVNTNKSTYNFINEKIKILRKQAIEEALKLLNKEKKQFLKDDNLNQALMVKKLIKTISDGKNDIDEFEEYPDSVMEIIQVYVERIDKVDELYNESMNKLKQKIIKDIKSLKIKSNIKTQLCDYIQENKLDLNSLPSKTEDIVNSVSLEATQTKTKNDNLSRISNEEQFVKKNAYALANNLLAVNLDSRQGKILFALAENLDKENKQIQKLRLNIEKNTYISIIPVKINMTDFITKLEVIVKNNLNTKNEFLYNTAAALLLLKPKTSLKISILKQVPEKVFLDYNKRLDTIFDGAEQAEELKLEVLDADHNKLKILLKKTNDLLTEYPFCLSLKNLYYEIKTSLDNTKDQAENQADKQENLKDKKSLNKNVQKEVVCPKCHGKKKILCPQCFGSGTITEKITCPQCDGKGTNWMKIKCSKCNGTGTIKNKMKCLNCNGTGYITCPKCNGSGSVQEKE